jgi:hypothetical protein
MPEIRNAAEKLPRQEETAVSPAKRLVSDGRKVKGVLTGSADREC